VVDAGLHWFKVELPGIQKLDYFLNAHLSNAKTHLTKPVSIQNGEERKRQEGK